MGFKSRGAALYDSSYFSQSISEAQQRDYVLGDEGIVQVNGVVMKLTSDNQFLLTVTLANFNDAIYRKLVLSLFDINTMNKFSTKSLDDGSYRLYDFIRTTPFGFEQNVPNGLGRRFWGTTCTVHTVCIPNAETGGCDIFTSTECCKYRLWIEFSCAWT